MDAVAGAVSEAAAALVAVKHCYDDRHDGSRSDDKGGDNNDDDKGGDNNDDALCKQHADGVVAAGEAAPEPLQIFQIINTNK
jgi:hypothetical protein